MTENVLEVRGLTRVYEGREVLSDVSLTLPKGEVHAVIGPSGCGKSTLLRCVSGLELFDRGEVRVAGLRLASDMTPADARKAIRAIRRRVGMVFQQFHLFPHRTALENVMEGLVWVLGKPLQEARHEAMALLREVGLEHRANAYPAELSGGEQQRVAIARAVATRPDVLLLDEPTSALDPPRAAEVRAAILRLAEHGQSMLLVTHSPGFARSTAQRVLMMDAGRIVEEGTPEEVFSSPSHPATIRFVKAAAYV